MVGRSYAEALLSGSPIDAHEDVYAYASNNGVEAAMIRSTEFQYAHFTDETPDELFNLLEDPGQQFNIASQHPDMVNRMKSRLLDRTLHASRSAREHHFVF